jgi:hypothetical protein
VKCVGPLVALIRTLNGQSRRTESDPGQSWKRCAAAASQQAVPALPYNRAERCCIIHLKFDVPENLEAVGVAKKLLAGEQLRDMELDNQARLLLSHDESYVKSHLSSATLRKPARKITVLSAKAKAEIDQYILAL